ncbi:MAG TPA: hypothetical protein VMU84_07220, partial [Thermoanaerobaculia bacterium]|nr:hypothetical protein [Thermoanaerobaculia bacterium]
MRMRLAVFLALFATTASSQILTTEVWVGDLAFKSFVVTNLVNVSNDHPGYDNQPAFFPDGKSLVYTSQVGELVDTGLGVNAVLVANGTSTPLP